MGAKDKEAGKLARPIDIKFQKDSKQTRIEMDNNGSGGGVALDKAKVGAAVSDCTDNDTESESTTSSPP